MSLDHQFYKTFYRDVSSLCSTDQEIEAHWEKYGIPQKRFGNAASYLFYVHKFDWEYYVARDGLSILDPEEAWAIWKEKGGACNALDIISYDDYDPYRKYHFPKEEAPWGVNVIGYINGRFGVGETAKCVISALDAGGIPHSEYQVRVPWHTFDEEEYPQQTPYRINLICIDKNSTPELPHQLVRGKYNIAIWAWELEEPSPLHVASAKYFDQIWTISSFCQRAFEGRIGQPVRVLHFPPRLFPVPSPGECREEFSLPQEKFICMFFFDLFSTRERKNAEGVIKAYKIAFGNCDKSLLLVKTINGEKVREQHSELAAFSCNNIQVINVSYPKDKTLRLLNACDVYISLHRAEGSGLTMMEAMALGKPVIATGYSGNLDFMDDDNSLLVGWEYTPVTGCYAKMVPGAQWAEPNVAEATAYLKMLYRNPWLRELYGSRGREKIIKKWTYQRLGQEIMDNLQCFMDQ
jgi:glycosyltransferase involved in cell wall biosynthesis